MPILPDKYSLGDGPQLASSRPVVSSDLSAPAKALEGFGDQLVKSGGEIVQDQRIQEAKKGEFDALRADSYFINAHSQLINGLKDDTDYKTLPERYEKAAGDLKENALNLVENPLQKAKLDVQLTRNIASGFGEVGTVARQEYRRQGAENYGSAYDDNLQLAQNAPKWQDAQAVMDKTKELTFSAVNNHFITPTHGAALLKQQRTVAARTFFDRDAQENPEEAKAALDQRLGGKATSAPSFTPEVNAAIDKAAADNSVPADYLYRTADIESQGQNIPTKVKGASSAGVFQFNDKTAKQYGITDKYDVNQSAQGGAKLYNDNKAELQKQLGYEPPDAQVYLAHQQGAGGATALLQNPEENAIQALVDHAKLDPKTARDHILNNGGDEKMTAGDFKDKWVDRYNNGNESGAKVDGKYSYLNYIPYSDILQKKNQLDKQIKINQNNGQVASLQKTADIFSTVNDGKANLSDIMADPSLSANDKTYAQALLLGSPEAINKAVKTAQSTKLTSNIEGLNSLSITQEIQTAKDKFSEEQDPQTQKSDKFLAEQLETHNNIIAKLNVARAVNMSNPGKGVNATEYKTLMSAVKNNSDKMYDDGTRGGGSLVGRVTAADTGFQALTDHVNDLTKDSAQRNQLLGYAYTWAQQNKIDLFNSNLSTSQRKQQMDAMFEAMQKARNAQLGVSAAAPATQAAIVGGKVEKLGPGSPDVKADSKVNVPVQVIVRRKSDGKQFYKAPDGTLTPVS